MTGSDAVTTELEDGVKRRNQRMRVGSTTTSEEVTPLIGLALGGILRSIKLRRRRFIVPLVRRVVYVMAERMDMAKRIFHGRSGLVVAMFMMIDSES